MTKIEKYRPRIADRLLERKLKGKGADWMFEGLMSRPSVIITEGVVLSQILRKRRNLPKKSYDICYIEIK